MLESRGDLFKCKPEFSEDPSTYEFAVAILEGKPVFVGDVVYHESGSKHIIAYRPNSLNGYSWNPPKKTFMLNGEETPCCVNTSPQHVIRIKVEESESFINFTSSNEAHKAMTAILKCFNDNCK